MEMCSETLKNLQSGAPLLCQKVICKIMYLRAFHKEVGSPSY